MRRALWVQSRAGGEGPALVAALRRHPAVVVRGVLAPATASTWARRVIAADHCLVDDFGGEQRALGRAFYTHVESGRAPEYFQDPTGSDDVVEAVLPGMQHFTRELLARLLGGVVRQRFGFCGPGVHVFPAGEKVARRGGVFHYDLEGLSGVDAGARAVSLVVMLQPGSTRGGLTLFSRQYRGQNWPMEQNPRSPATTTTAGAGDAVLFSSYRLHRINGFGGDHARISITCHAVEVDDDVWDCWF